jgi:hypothetical protein
VHDQRVTWREGLARGTVTYRAGGASMGRR